MKAGLISQYALLYVLGYEFVPRIKNLKDKQLYRIEKDRNDSIFAPFLTKIADTELVEEQWDTIMRLGWSLLQRTASAHVVIQRLTNSPTDRLSKALTALGRLLRTQDSFVVHHRPEDTRRQDTATQQR